MIFGRTGTVRREEMGLVIIFIYCLLSLVYDGFNINLN